MFDKVFISYATEDINYAKKLYEFLNENNFIPWLDKNNLLPGQQWDFEIKKALREANYVILLLSDTSVEKRGYVQREFKTALKYYEEKLEDDIYLIPVKINKCHPPEMLSGFQWIELEGESSFNTILLSLNIQQNKYLYHQQRQLNKKTTFETKEIKDNYLYKNRNNVNYSILSNTIEFVDISNHSLNELNQFITGKKIEYILSNRGLFMELGDPPNEIEYERDWFFELNVSLNYLNSNVCSLVENSYSYTGGAHGNTFVTGYNFLINPNFKLELEHLFNYSDHDVVLNFLSDFCFEKLRQIINENIYNDEEEKLKQTKDTLFWEGSLDPKWENFNNYIISKDNITIIFNQYQVSSYAFGIQLIEVPLEELVKLPIDRSKLIVLIEKLK